MRGYHERTFIAACSHKLHSGVFHILASRRTEEDGKLSCVDRGIYYFCWLERNQGRKAFWLSGRGTTTVAWFGSVPPRREVACCSPLAFWYFKKQVYYSFGNMLGLIVCISAGAVIYRLFAISCLLDRMGCHVGAGKLLHLFPASCFSWWAACRTAQCSPQLFVHFGVRQSSVLVTNIQQLLSAFWMLFPLTLTKICPQVASLTACCGAMHLKDTAQLWASCLCWRKALPTLKFLAAVEQIIHSLSKQTAHDFTLISATNFSI